MLDVIFVIDNSGSVDAAEMEKQKNFIQKLVESFTIADDNTRVGVIRFGTSDTAPVMENLNAGNNLATVTSTISTLVHRKEYTNTPAGINGMSNMYRSQGSVD